MPGRFSSDHSRSLSQTSLSRHPSQPPEPTAHRRSTAADRVSVSNPNVFSDEYALDSINAEEFVPRASISSVTASPFRSSTVVGPKPLDSPTPEAQAAPTEDPFGDDAQLPDEMPHRSSLPPKGIQLENTNPHDSINQGARRSQSISSRFSIPVQPMSPYTGATGPSHPYAMYSQGVGRSPSVATTSTVRPTEQPLGDASAPQHPYAMYPQNVVLEEDSMDTTTTAAAIPLGFSGHNLGYQPPHGGGQAADDVGDIVGPDGHTEQLPPYSRYPDGVVPKVAPAAGMLAADTVHDAGVMREASHPSGYEAALGSESSSRVLMPAAGVTTDANENRRLPVMMTAAAAGVMAFEEKLKAKGRQKACCGLPIWTLVLIGVVLLIGACIGGVIGGVLGARRAQDGSHKSKGPKIVTVTATPEMDATPISSTYQNLLPLPTGEYYVPASPKNQSKFCVADSSYRSAWGCMNEGGVTIDVGGSSTSRTVSFANQPITGSFTYGAQAPYLPTATQSLSMMFDTSELALGPALFFYTYIDKLVIVPQGSFPTSGSSKRAITERDVLASSWNVKQVSKAGDLPYFCWWNSTVMEFFLYINESTTATNTTAATTAAATTGSSQKVKRDSLEDYPRRIKIEEKRDYAEALAPYCQQMQVLDDGQVVTASPDTITIQEVEPTPTTTVTGTGQSGSQTYTAKAQYESACYCISLT
ncbi:hypothetical protein ASPZODRAFT_127598, partial [Penicilliopsis zonata CBS 506.65]